jgi:hypothetical protein
MEINFSSVSLVRLDLIAAMTFDRFVLKIHQPCLLQASDFFTMRGSLGNLPEKKSV